MYNRLHVNVYNIISIYIDQAVIRISFGPRAKKIHRDDVVVSRKDLVAEIGIPRRTSPGKNDPIKSS